MMLAARQVLVGDGLVSPLWITASLLLLTLGEMCLSPVGLSTMSTLAPRRIRGQLMGLWFTSLALGNLVAGLIGGNVSADKLAELPALFGRSAVALVLCALVLALLTPLIGRMLKGSQREAAASSPTSSTTGA